MKYFYTVSTLFIFSLLCNPIANFAQQNSDAEIKDRIRAAEITYLSQKLSLTADEAQRFLPLYNQYTKEVELLIAERRTRSAALETERNNTGDDNELGYDQRMLNIKTRYSKEFQKVLPASKASSVFKSEREFRGQLIRAMKERQSRNVGGPGARRFRQ
jgi:hypothetical protein